jgi:hypothetical protein
VAPRSAGPDLGRPKSPLGKLIERLFETESPILPTAIRWTVGATSGPSGLRTRGSRRTTTVPAGPSEPSSPTHCPPATGSRSPPWISDTEQVKPRACPVRTLKSLGDRV